MSTHHRSDDEIIRSTHNTSRFFVENRQLAWVILLGTLAWGVYGYITMPQRKDPDIPARQAMVVTNWPGASAEKVEQLVTRTVEQTVASNSNIARIESISRANVSYVTLTLSDRWPTPVRLSTTSAAARRHRNLPQGAGPVNFQRDFGDTATLYLLSQARKPTSEIGFVRGNRRRNHGRSSGERFRPQIYRCLPSVQCRQAACAAGHSAL